MKGEEAKKSADPCSPLQKNQTGATQANNSTTPSSAGGLSLGPRVQSVSETAISPLGPTPSGHYGPIGLVGRSAAEQRHGGKAAPAAVAVALTEAQAAQALALLAVAAAAIDERRRRRARIRRRVGGRRRRSGGSRRGLARRRRALEGAPPRLCKGRPRRWDQQRGCGSGSLCCCWVFCCACFSCCCRGFSGAQGERAACRAQRGFVKKSFFFLSLLRVEEFVVVHKRFVFFALLFKKPSSSPSSLLFTFRKLQGAPLFFAFLHSPSVERGL